LQRTGQPDGEAFKRRDWLAVTSSKTLWLESKPATDACVSASQWGKPDEIAPFACHRTALADRFCPEGVGATGVALHLARELARSGSEITHLSCFRYTACSGFTAGSRQFAGKRAPTLIALRPLLAHPLLHPFQAQPECAVGSPGRSTMIVRATWRGALQVAPTLWSSGNP
jgi:hypothetical protein